MPASILRAVRCRTRSRRSSARAPDTSSGVPEVPWGYLISVAARLKHPGVAVGAGSADLRCVLALHPLAITDLANAAGTPKRVVGRVSDGFRITDSVSP